jgi:hypothetical protein
MKESQNLSIWGVPQVVASRTEPTLVESPRLEQILLTVFYRD